MGLNWWMYPIRRKATIDLYNSEPISKLQRIKKRLIRLFIIHEQVELPPGIDSDPITTSSEATVGDPNDYPMKGKRDPLLTRKVDFDDIKDDTL